MTMLIFVHGWGSGDFVWDEILPAFSDYDTHTINMGFVDEENMRIPEGKFIGIGHSLGGLWLLKHYPDQMVGFISIASFNCFYKHVPTQILNAMKRNMIKDSAKQIADFWNHAGLDQPSGFMHLNPLKLIEGIKWLSQWKADIPDIPVKVLAARDDYIVIEKMTRDIWKEYDIEWREDGGHMLPMTQAKWCIGHIKEFIDLIDENADNK